jgi:type I restriction enzyme S subunit
MSAGVVERDDTLSTGEPWSLPEGWNWMPLGKLGVWNGGGTPSKAVASYWTGGAIPWVSPKDMKTVIITDTQDKITEVAVENSSTKFISPNSILMVMRSGILRHTFPVAVNQNRVTLNQDLRALSPFEGVDAHFVAHYLRLIQRVILHECSKDGTTVQSIEVSALEKTLIPIPPHSEQLRIVARIDELFAELAEGAARLQSARAGLEIWRRALFKAAVSGKLTEDWRQTNVPVETGAELRSRLQSGKFSRRSRRRWSAQIDADVTGIESPFEIPATWAWGRLGQLGDIVGGVTVDKKRSPTNAATVPYLRVANVQRGYFDLSEIKTICIEREIAKKLLLRSNDILLNEGGDRDKIGRGWVWEDQVPNCIHQNHVFRVRLHDSGLNAVFISHYANEMGRRFFIEKGKQTTNLASISLSKISELPIPIPPTEESTVIIERLNQYLINEEDDRRDIDDTEKLDSTLRQSILKFAFEGRLVKRSANEKIAPELLSRPRSETVEQSAYRRRPVRANR